MLVKITGKKSMSCLLIKCKASALAGVLAKVHMNSMPTNKHCTKHSPQLSPSTNTNMSTTTAQFRVELSIAVHKFRSAEPGTSSPTIARAKFRRSASTINEKTVVSSISELLKNQSESCLMLKVKCGSCRRTASLCRSLLAKSVTIDLTTLTHEHALQGVIVLNTVTGTKHNCFKRHLRHADRYLCFSFNTLGKSAQQTATAN